MIPQRARGGQGEEDKANGNRQEQRNAVTSRAIQPSPAGQRQKGHEGWQKAQRLGRPIVDQRGVHGAGQGKELAQIEKVVAVIKDPRAQQSLGLHPAALGQSRQPEEGTQAQAQQSRQYPSANHTPVAGQVAFQEHPARQQRGEQESKEIVSEDESGQAQSRQQEKAAAAVKQPTVDGPQNERRKGPGKGLG